MGDENLRKILIVEDNPKIMQLTKRLVSRIGDFKIYEAQNGAEALKIIQQEGVNLELVLLDIMMPKMTGLEFLEEIDSTFIERSFKICMLTSLNEEETVQKALKLKTDDYIVKPIDAPIFTKKICSLLESYDNDKSRFASVFASLETKLLNLPIDIDITVTRISEYQITFESKHLLKEGHKVAFNLPQIGIDQDILCKIIGIQKPDSRHVYIAEFVALDENQRKIIRKITIRGQRV